MDLAAFPRKLIFLLRVLSWNPCECLRRDPYRENYLSCRHNGLWIMLQLPVWMQYHGWQWKCTQVRKFKFMTSGIVWSPPTLVCSVFYVIVLPVKFMPQCALRVSYGYPGNLNFAFPDFCVFKGTSFQKWRTKSIPDWLMLCNSLCLWNGNKELPWLGLFWVFPGLQFTRTEENGRDWGEDYAASGGCSI